MESPAESHALGATDCHTEVASYDYGEDSDLDDNRFRYVFQDTDDYPYYRKVEGAFIGIRTGFRIADERRPGESLWQARYGRRGVGAEGHYSFIHDFRGRTEFQGVALRVTAGSDFAFFLYDRERDSRANYYAHVAERGLLDVMTTTEDGAAFVDVDSLEPSNPRFHTSRSILAGGGERSLSGKHFRTLFFIDNVVTVAGEEHRARKVCRLDRVPLVVTNSVELVPAIEEELAQRARKLDRARTVRSGELAVGEFRETFDDLPPKSWIPLMLMLQDHAAEDEEWNNLGHVQLVFSRDPYDRSVAVPGDRHRQQSFVARIAGEIVVNGNSLGTFRRCVSARTPAGYYIGGFVEAQTYDRIVFGDDLERGCRTACEEGMCRLEVWKSLVPKAAVSPVSEARVESMKERQARIDVVNDFAASKAEWLEAYAGLEEDVMVPLLVVERGRGKSQRSHSRDHAALGPVRLSFETGSNPRSSMTEESGRRLRFRLPGRLAVGGATLRLPSDAVAAVVEFRRSDGKTLYQEIKKGAIEVSRLRRLVAGKAPEYIGMRNFGSPAFRVMCRAGSCKLFASKGELERRIGH